MKLIPTFIDGCFQIDAVRTQDERGTFVKTFNSVRFSELGLPTEWSEEYYSSSLKGVIRGMHFQTPPHDHEKLVYCIHGQVLDVALDLRTSSKTCGHHLAIILDSAHGNGLLIPKGMAHGFLALSDNALMAYKVTTVYSSDNDTGIRWNSFGFDWKIERPIMSDRDRKHPLFADFVSPF
jgi:dTDP-4-dehydrorhamnose 3,5-epimerase